MNPQQPLQILTHCALSQSSETGAGRRAVQDIGPGDRSIQHSAHVDTRLVQLQPLLGHASSAGLGLGLAAASHSHHRAAQLVCSILKFACLLCQPVACLRVQGSNVEKASTVMRCNCHGWVAVGLWGEHATCVSTLFENPVRLGGGSSPPPRPAPSPRPPPTCCLFPRCRLKGCTWCCLDPDG